jgi:hypothetical protein
LVAGKQEVVLMKRMMMLVLGVLAVGAVSAFSSAGASAAGLCAPTAEEHFHVCLFLSTTELELLESSTFSLLQEEGEPHELEIKFSAPLTVSCATGTGETTGEGELIMKTKVNFTGCTVTGEEGHCEVTNKEIESRELDGTLSLQTELESSEEGLRLDVLLSPEIVGNPLATFSIKSKTGATCLEATTNGKVTGEQLCFFLEEIEKDMEEHLLECPKSGSTLKYAGNESTLQTEFSVLMATPVSDASWSIDHDT